MLKRMLIILVLALAQTGCSVEEGVGPYKLTPLTDEVLKESERDRRELLTIEDLKIGDGPLAAWGRRLTADIEVRYSDGTIAYVGSIWINIGFDSDVFLYNATDRAGALDYGQPGIWLGLIGMAVEGKQRCTINPQLVSGGVFTKGTQIRHEKLVVEAILAESCVPILLRAIYLPTTRYMLEREVWCRSHDELRRSPSDPLWRFY